MLYLLDANVLITAHSQYYPLDRVPEYWEWLHHMCKAGHVKMPLEVYEEVKDGPTDEDPLYGWLQTHDVKSALLLPGEAKRSHVRHITTKGYAADLTDSEVEHIGRDPFLIAHGYADARNRCIVTVETSQPSKQRHKRKVPDVCTAMGVRWCDPFAMTRELGFSTDWKRRLQSAA